MVEQPHGEERSRTYLYVFVALAIFTALEVGVSYLDDLPETLQLAALVGLAMAKIALVVLWFMHLRYDRRVFAVPFVLGLLLVVPLVLIVAITLDEEAESEVGVETNTPTDVEEADTVMVPDGAQNNNVSENAPRTLEITQTDAGLDLSTTTVAAGEVQFQITNESAEERQVALIRPGMSPGWMLPWHGAMESLPFEMVQSGVDVPPDDTTDLTVSMEPGRYVVMSGLPQHTIGNEYAVVWVTGTTTTAQEEPASGEEIVLSGGQLVDERCTQCHDLERVDNQDKTREEWADTVDRMIGYGAQLNEEERQAVIAYLTETH